MKNAKSCSLRFIAPGIALLFGTPALSEETSGAPMLEDCSYGSKAD